MIDICANLTASAFDGDRRAVIERAFGVGVDKMIVTGASESESPQAAAIAEQYPARLFSTAGVHPHHAKDCGASTLDTLRSLAALPVVVAIGECGLDYDRDFSPRPTQRQWFEAQIQLAIDVSLPLFVHERQAAQDLVAIFDGFGRLPPIVVHCFTGDESVLRHYLDRDFYIGITGWICDERRGMHLRDLVRFIPAGRLMIETDAPYLLPRTIHPRPKSRRNEPAFLPHVRDLVAACRSETPDELTRHTSATACEFFRLAAR